MANTTILEKANAAIRQGDHEGFLSLCTEDTKWIFIGDKILEGKEAVRQWMATEYMEPPTFTVDKMIAEDDYVVALGRISIKDEKGEPVYYMYSDVWRFSDGKMAELKAFVVKE